MATTIVGEQGPRAYGIVGPYLFTASLAANTPTAVLITGAAAYEHKVPMFSAGLVAALSCFRNAGTAAGDVTVQLASVPAAAATGTALAAVSGASLVAPAAGGAAYTDLLPSGGKAFAAGDMLGIILTTATAGSCLLTVNLVITT